MADRGKNQRCLKIILKKKPQYTLCSTLTEDRMKNLPVESEKP